MHSANICAGTALGTEIEWETRRYEHYLQVYNLECICVCVVKQVNEYLNESFKIVMYTMKKDRMGCQKRQNQGTYFKRRIMKIDRELNR